jgi:hypothetical protein
MATAAYADTLAGTVVFLPAACTAGLRCPVQLCKKK